MSDMLLMLAGFIVVVGSLLLASHLIINGYRKKGSKFE